MYEAAGIGLDDIDVIQLQDTNAGAEVIRLAENGFGATGKQEKFIADPKPRSAARWRPTPTAGSSPTAKP